MGIMNLKIRRNYSPLFLRKRYLEKLYKHLCNQKTDFKEWQLCG